jgi:hypothetical protein
MTADQRDALSEQFVKALRTPVAEPVVVDIRQLGLGGQEKSESASTLGDRAKRRRVGDRV